MSDADTGTDTRTGTRAGTRTDGRTDGRAGTRAADPAAPRTSACPGCGAVLAVVPGLAGTHPGASPGCAELYRVTLGGLREEAGQDARAAVLLQLAEDAYDAQHLLDDEPAASAVRLCLWLERDVDPLRAAELGARVAEVAPRLRTRPTRWTTTIGDLAADLDVVDLPALVRSWAEAVWTDWAPAHPALRGAAAAIS